LTLKEQGTPRPAIGAATDVRDEGGSWMNPIFSPSGSRRRRRSLFGAVTALLLVSAFVLPNAFAVHDDGVFQLDGNATQADHTGAIDHNGFGDDWDQVCHQVTITDDTTNAIPNECASANNTTGAKAVSWVSEPDRSTSIYTGGGSKDPQDVNNWLWKNAGGLPDKDNLRHAFAARYSGDSELLYFGSDRFDNSGDAQQGFWFLQDPLVDNGGSSQGGNLFTDGSGGTPHHRVGDLLVISDFSIGGSVSTINIYSWVASGGDTTAHLQFEDGGDNVKCTPVLANDNFCGIVNPGPGLTASPWSFLDKGGNTSFANGEFYEAGIDLTGLGFDDECFSTVVSETRSSTSPTATLKDFVVGSFGKCETTLVTTPKAGDGTALAADTDNDNLVEASIGTGTVSVTDSAVLTVAGVNSFTGTLAFFICGPITTPTACATGGVAAGSSTVTANGTYSSTAVTLSSVGRYCWRGVFTSGSNNVPDASDSTVESAGSTGECFEVLPVQSTLDTQAVASPVDFGQAVQDNATLGGTATQPGTGGSNATYPTINATTFPAAGGKITFTLLKANCTDLATGTGTNPQDITTISGNGTYGPVSFTPDAPGTYHWKAVYTPAGTDVNNLGSTHNAACGDADETVVVSQVQTGITTRQFVFPQDKAVITAAGGGNLAGNVAFKLFDSSANCTLNGSTVGQGGLLYAPAATTISGASPQSATTNNTSVRITLDATVYWRVTYTSTNQAQLGSSSVCLENTAVTYSGNDGTITIP
jgi:hypothetical protein